MFLDQTQVPEREEIRPSEWKGSLICGADGDLVIFLPSSITVMESRELDRWGAVIIPVEPWRERDDERFNTNINTSAVVLFATFTAFIPYSHWNNDWRKVPKVCAPLRWSDAFRESAKLFKILYSESPFPQSWAMNSAQVNAPFVVLECVFCRPPILYREWPAAIWYLN